MPAPDSSTSLPHVRSEEFEGPLDLLLDEVRRQNVEIENIAMAPIVARFLDYLGTAAARNLNLDMEWLHMAAILIHWKSQSLLPPEPDGSGGPDSIRDSLVHQLVAHREQLARELGRRRTREQGRIPRSSGSVAEPEPSQSMARPLLSVWDMVQHARELARWVEGHREELRQWQELEIEQDDVSVYEMIEYLGTELAAGDGDKVDGTKLLLEQRNPARRACLFLGMLEMAREQRLFLDQNETFGPLWLSVP